jgi:hypothetical protein
MHPARQHSSYATGTGPSEEIKAQTSSLKIQEAASSGPPAAGGSFVGASSLHNSISWPHQQPKLPLQVPPGCLCALGGSPPRRPSTSSSHSRFFYSESSAFNLKAVAFNNLIPNQSQSGNQT